jgi:hypothetical protein
MSAATISATTAAVITASLAAAAAGATAYESNNASIDQAAAEQQQKQATQQAANQVNLTKQEAVLGEQGQSQQQTGGSLTDSGTAALTDLLAGYPGYQAGNAGTGGTISGGTGTGTGTGAAASTPDISAILAALTNGAIGAGGTGGGGGLGSSGNLSGGNWPTPSAQPQPYQQLATPVLG